MIETGGNVADLKDLVGKPKEKKIERMKAY